MLPSIFNTPAYFTYHELKYTPEFFAEEGRSQLNSIQKCFSSLKQFMSNCSKKMRDVRFTFDDVRWAWNAVNTRCVYMNKELKFNTAFQQNDSISCCLAPLLDLLNHSCAVQVILFSFRGLKVELIGEETFRKRGLLQRRAY